MVYRSLQCLHAHQAIQRIPKFLPSGRNSGILIFKKLCHLSAIRGHVPGKPEDILPITPPCLFFPFVGLSRRTAYRPSQKSNQHDGQAHRDAGKQQRHASALLGSPSGVFPESISGLRHANTLKVPRADTCAHGGVSARCLWFPVRH